MKINVALAVSKDWFGRARVTATSVLVNSNPEDDYCFFILSNGFKENDKKYFCELQKIRNVDINFIELDDEYFKDAIHDWLGVSASYRLRLQTFVNEDKILYLDSDIVAMKDIRELYEIDVSDYYLGAVEDKCSNMMKQRVNLKEDEIFFNSGMQLINLEMFRKDNIEEKFMQKLRESDIYTDQDVMNDICRGKILSLPLKYNLMESESIYGNRTEEYKEALEQPVLYHYYAKPWTSSHRVGKFKIWYDYQEILGGADIKRETSIKFLHSMIRVRDIEKSLRFYEEVLNMKLDHRKRLDDCWLYFLTDEGKTCQIELTYNDETPENGYDIGSGFGHFAFSVSSLDDFTDKLCCLGYEYLYPPFDLNGKGTKIAFIQDPDGYEIELIEKVIW